MPLIPCRKQRNFSCLIAGILLRFLMAPAPLQGDEYYLTRKEAVDLGLENSTETRLQELELALLKRRIQLGVLDYLPRIELGINVDDGITVNAPDDRRKRLFFTIRQPLYNGGVFRSARMLAKEELRLRGKTADYSRIDLSTSIWDICSSIIIEEKKLELRRRLFLLTEERISILKKEFSFGNITELEVLDMELQARDAKMQVAAAEKEIEKLRFSLYRLLEIPENSRVVIDDSIDTAFRGITETFPREVLLLHAEANNHEIQTARYRLYQEEKSVSLSHSAFVPAISVSATFFVEGERFPLSLPGLTVQFHISFSDPILPVKMTSTFGSKGTDQYSRGFHGSMSVLENISGHIDKKEGELNVQRKRRELEDLEREIAFSVEDTMSEYRRQQEIIALSLESINLFKRKLSVLEKRVRNGTATEFERLEELVQFNNRKVVLLEQILALIKIERKLESLLGLPPEGLIEFISDEKGQL